MTNEQKEIRSILLGRTVPGENGKLTSIAKGTFYIPTGIGDGADAVRLLGMARRARCYETKLDPEQTLAVAEQAMRNIGRGLELREQPEAAACLIRYVLTRPAVLTFRYVEERPVLTGWTGRGLTGWISLRRAIAAFERELPEEIRATEEKPPEMKKPKPARKRRRKRTEENQTPDEPPAQEQNETEEDEQE